MRELLNDWIDSIRESRKEQRRISIYQDIVWKAAYAGSPFLKHFLGHRITFAIMAMLQFISFFTTYAGGRFYLEGINELAPFLFAGVIQGGLLYYANIFSATGNKKVRYGVFLAVFTVISIVFSYTGMAVSNLPPEQEYLAAYEDYCSVAEGIKKQLLQENSTLEEIEQSINDFWTDMESCMSKADAEISALGGIIETLNESIENGNVSSTTRNRWNGSTTYTEEPGELAIKASEEKILYEKKKKELETAKQNFEGIKQSVSLEQIQNYVKRAEKDDAQGNAMNENMSRLIDAYNQVANRLGDEVYPNDYIISLAEKFDKNQQITELPLDMTESYLDAQTDNTNFMGEMFAVISDFFAPDVGSAAKARETLNNLKTVIRKNYNEIQETVKEVAPDKIDVSLLKESKEKLEQYGDPNMQALAYLVDAKYMKKVLGIFGMAVLIDGLTFLLGIFGNKRPLSLLSSNTNRDFIDNEEQLFSIVFISLVGGKAPDEFSNPETDKEFKEQCHRYVKDIKKSIQDFLGEFQNSPWTAELGYGLWAKYGELKKVSGAVQILSVLQQLNYLQYLTPTDFEVLKDKFTDNIDDKKQYPKPISEPELDEYICILRYRVEVYFHHNIAEIATQFGESNND
jgi:hypothetical protein